MNLLPKCHTDFAKESYWEEFFKKRGKAAFEWYGEYLQLCSLLNKYIRATDKILVVGCGNSNLSADIYDHRAECITNIDVSETVIKQMREVHKKREKMTYIKMDVSQMEFDDETYSVVLDKGTLDALLPDRTEERLRTVNEMFSEISRVLKEGGRYICITLAQSQILEAAMAKFTENGGWLVRIHHIPDVRHGEVEWPVFMLVFTKFSSLTRERQVLEASLLPNQLERFSNATNLISTVEQVQHYFILQQQLKSNNTLEEETSIELYSSDNAQNARYTLHILHGKPSTRDQKCALFIAPIGRECEWIFSCAEGRTCLCGSAGFARLILACLSRHHTYSSMELVKEELADAVKSLTPPNAPDNYKVPILTLGEDAVSCRNVIYKGESEISGKFLVEEIEREDGNVVRALVFLDAPHIRQSEVLVKKRRGKRKSQMTVVDLDIIASHYYYWVLAGYSLLTSQDRKRTLSTCLIGLGGGGLSMLVAKHFPQVRSEVVELDPVIAQIAKEYFNFSESEKLTLFLVDGLKHINDVCERGEKRDVIIVDVDNKDVELGISCPPLPFTQIPVLEKFKKVLHTNGVLILNLVARSRERKVEVLERLKIVFPLVLQRQLESDLNEIVYCIPRSVHNVADLESKLDDVIGHDGGESMDVHRLIKDIHKMGI